MTSIKDYSSQLPKELRDFMEKEAGKLPNTESREAGPHGPTHKSKGSDPIIPLTTKGDLFTFGTDVERLPAGKPGQVLLIDPAEAVGLKWVDPDVKDKNALHKSTAGDIHSLVKKELPVGDDEILLEDSENSWGKRRASLKNLPATAPSPHSLAGHLHTSTKLADLNAKISDAKLDDVSGNRTDANAVHFNVSEEIHKVANKSAPFEDDEILVEDSEDLWKKKRISLATLLTTVPTIHELAGVYHSKSTLEDLNSKISDAKLDDVSGTRTDSAAIHANRASEIHKLSAKDALCAEDEIILEDSSDLWNKKRTSVSSFLAKAKSPLESKGDLYTHDGKEGKRLPVGIADGQVLRINSESELGIGWGFAFSDTKSPIGVWASPTTINFFSRFGKKYLNLLTFQDGKQRSMLEGVWSTEKGENIGGYDAASSAGNNKWLYFYAVPKKDDDSQFTIVASANSLKDGPVGYQNYRLVWKTFVEPQGTLRRFVQSGNYFSLPMLCAVSVEKNVDSYGWRPQDLSKAIPVGAGIVFLYVKLVSDNNAGYLLQLASCSGNPLYSLQVLPRKQAYSSVSLLVDSDQTIYKSLSQMVEGLITEDNNETCDQCHIYCTGFIDREIDA